MTGEQPTGPGRGGRTGHPGVPGARYLPKEFWPVDGRPGKRPGGHTPTIGGWRV